MPADIVLLPGASAPPETAPAEGVVAILEHLLETARRGDTRAIAYAAVTKDGECVTGWVRGAPRNHALTAAIEDLKFAHQQERLDAYDVVYGPDDEGTA